MAGQIVLYDYECTRCGCRDELYSTYLERDQVKFCPMCEDLSMFRIVSAPHVSIKPKDRACG